MPQSEAFPLNLIFFPDPNPYETDRFAQDYCRSFILGQVPNARIFPHNSNPLSLKDIKIFCEGQTAVFMESTVVLLGKGLAALAKKATQCPSLAIAPVVGGIETANQAPDLPFVYLDLPTFEETAEWMHTNNPTRIRPVSQIMPNIFACSFDFLNRFPDEMELSGFLKSPMWQSAEKQIMPHILAHSFSGYHSQIRPDVADLVPQTAQIVLDVGCGAGGLGTILHSRTPAPHLTGIEPAPRAAGSAEGIYDRVYQKKIEEFETTHLYDCIVCADVLEHLKDPELAVSRFFNMIRPGGSLVGACPNAAHWTVVAGLLNGNFEYLPAGILCRDHLRFFTKETLTHLLSSAGFSTIRIQEQTPPPTPRGRYIIQALSHAGLGDENRLSTAGFLFSAVKDG